MAKVLSLPHKTTFDTSWNMLECHKVSRLPREMKLCDAGNLQKWPLLQNLPWARPYGPHADGCGRKHKANTAQPPHAQSETGTLATHSGKQDYADCIYIYIYHNSQLLSSQFIGYGWLWFSEFSQSKESTSKHNVKVVTSTNQQIWWLKQCLVPVSFLSFQTDPNWKVKYDEPRPAQHTL